MPRRRSAPNRLRPPRPAVPWSGVRNATRLGPEPPQVAPPSTGGPAEGAAGGLDGRHVRVCGGGTRRAVRGLPEPQRLDAGSRRGTAAGDGLDPGRHVRAQLDGGLRREPLRPGRRRLRRHQLASRRGGVPLSRRRHRQPRPARPGRGAAVGAGEHRCLRRGPRQRHGLRRVRRRDEHRHAARDAPRRGAVPAGDPAERRSPPGHAGCGRAAHRRVPGRKAGGARRRGRRSPASGSSGCWRRRRN